MRIRFAVALITIAYAAETNAQSIPIHPEPEAGVTSYWDRTASTSTYGFHLSSSWLDGIVPSESSRVMITRQTNGVLRVSQDHTVDAISVESIYDGPAHGGRFYTAHPVTAKIRVDPGVTLETGRLYLGQEFGDGGSSLEIYGSGTIDSGGTTIRWGDLIYSGNINASLGTILFWSADTEAFVVRDNATVSADEASAYSADGTVRIEGGQLTLISFDTGNGNIGSDSIKLDHYGGELVINGGLFNPGDSVTGSSTDFHITGASAGDHAVVTLQGGATWDVPGILTVGQGGDGSLNVESGSVVDGVTFFRVGHGTGRHGVVTVDGNGSSMDAGSVASIGISEAGTLNVSDGGHFEAGRIQIGLDTGATGEVNVGGAGSMLTTAHIDVGGRPAGYSGGVGSLSVSDGGAVESSGDTRVWDDGTLSVEGGTFTTNTLAVLSGHLQVGANGAFLAGDVEVGGGGGASTATVDGGTVESDLDIAIGVGADSGRITLKNGGVLAAGNDISVETAGRLDGNGVLTPMGRFVNVGVTAPGLSVGAITVDGDATLGDDGKLEVELEDTASFDEFHVTGDLVVGGELEVSLIGDEPTLGDSFRILTAAAVSGSFSTVDLPAIGGLSQLAVAYGGDNVTIVAAPLLEGDFNGDGAVDAADYTVWRDSLGGATNLAADANLDTVVDEADYAIWESNFGASLPLPAASTGVPEPGAALLACFATAAIAGTRSHSHRLATRRV